MTILYFSATGNSLYVSKYLSQKIYAIPQLLKLNNTSITDDNAIGIVLPVYAQIIDPYFEHFLSIIRLHTPYLFAILTHGKAMGMAGDHLQHILQQKGLHLSYLNSLEMVDNYLPMFAMQEQVAQNSQKSIDAQLAQIRTDLDNKKGYIKSSPYFYSPVQQEEIILCQEFIIEEHCTGCTTCLQVCPLNNIYILHKYPQFGKTCINCLACTHNCPQNAIRLKSELSKNRYRHERITLEEIIDSNRQ